MSSLLASHPWLIATWLGAILLLVAMTRLIRPRPFRGVVTLHHESRGGSYATSLLLCFPLYSLLIAAIVETSLLLTVAIGMQHAAHAAGRAARVWLPAECSQATIERHIHLAAFQALTPVASAHERHVHPALPPDPEGDAAFVAAFHAYGGKDLVPDSYLLAKRSYARGATKVEWEQLNSTGEYVVTVKHTVPIRIPGMGPLFGTTGPTAGRPFWSRTLESRVAVTLETPLSHNRKMGIRYGQPH